MVVTVVVVIVLATVLVLAALLAAGQADRTMEGRHAPEPAEQTEPQFHGTTAPDTEQVAITESDAHSPLNLHE